MKEKYEIGNIVFDKKEAKLTNTKACLYLNNKECEVMEILVNNQERNVSKKEIKQKVKRSKQLADIAKPVASRSSPTLSSNQTDER